MPQKPNPLLPKGQSRRSFLGKLSLGLLALGGVMLFSRGLFRSRSTRTISEMEGFPDKDSIYHPRRDPRIESKERKA